MKCMGNVTSKKYVTDELVKTWRLAVLFLYIYWSLIKVVFDNSVKSLIFFLAFSFSSIGECVQTLLQSITRNGLLSSQRSSHWWNQMFGRNFWCLCCWQMSGKIFFLLFLPFYILIEKNYLKETDHLNLLI